MGTGQSGAAELAQTDDEVLMARFTAGHAAAFTELYDRYEGPIYGFCVRLLGDRDQADDAFQETFIHVVERQSAYRSRGRFRGWIFTLARNVCMDRARTEHRRSRLLTLHPAPNDAEAKRLDQVVELRDELTRVLATLPSDQREILLLNRYEGFSYAEIAEMTASTEVAVKQKAYRAVRALRSDAVSDLESPSDPGGTEQ